LIPSQQPKTDLVDEFRRLKRGVGPLARHVTKGHAVQLVVDERDEALERTLVAIAPETQQACDVAAGRLLERLHPEGLGASVYPHSFN
jgi:hypothetical protein